MESTGSSTGFQQYWLILKRRWMPASCVLVSVFTLAALSLLFQKPIYLAEGKIRFYKTDTTSSLTGLGKEAGQLDPLQEQGSPLATEAETIRSAPITQKLITTLDLKDRHGDRLKLKQFLKQLKVSSVEGTDILLVSYKDIDPQKAARVVNTIMAVYLVNNQQDKRGEVIAARKFIEEQLPKAEATVRQAELALRSFKEKNKVIALDEEAKSAVAVIQDLERQINLTEIGLVDAKAQSSLLRNELGRNLQQSGAVTSVSQSPAVQEVLRQIQQIESQLAIERSRFQENHPTITSLESKKTDLDRLLQEQIKRVLGGKKINSNNSNLQNSPFEQNLTGEFVKSEARRLGLISQATALSNLQATYRQRVNVLPSLEQKQRELERQLQVSQSTYAVLLQKFQESRIAENQTIGNARILASALVFDDPVAPRKDLYLGAGALLGLLLGVATAFVLEAKDKSIRTIDEARRMFGFTLLGVIPASKKSEKTTLLHGLERSTPEIVVKDYPRPLSTAYRMLQAKLKFLSSDTKLKVIVVTSSVPKEGKSTVSANLAVAMAGLGRKVLLVDADLHRPLQHQIWNLPNQLGLSNLIMGQAELKTAIKEVMLNLDVLPSGTMPPNPMALLDSQPMASLIDIFSANYDCTIIDTPSLSVDADASILGRMSDGVLLVVRPGVVDSATAVLVKEFLEQSNQNVLGQVINGVISTNEPYGYSYLLNKDNAAENTTPVTKSSLVR